MKPMSDKFYMIISFLLMIIVSIAAIMDIITLKKLSEAERDIKNRIDNIHIYHTITDATALDATVSDATVTDATETDCKIIKSAGNILYNPDESKAEEAVTESTKTDAVECNENYMGNYELTAYIATGSPCADGVYPQAGWTVASNDSKLWHHKIRIEGYGEYYVHDTGGMASNVIDVFVGSYDEAIQFGRRRGEVYIID